MAMETLETDGLILRSRSSDILFGEAAHVVNFEAHVYGIGVSVRKNF